ncbi:MAG TPA: sigma-70 family RNA polymerase sigma factor [Cyclobacteriaceae bacterium]|nr:sigma-70 family RNA polymerase sigma factor [Cyclobacteriaceae bacterium]
MIHSLAAGTVKSIPQASDLAETFSAEIVRHRGIILKICRIYGKENGDADDLYQEIVLNAWTSYVSFERRSKFSTWLYRVALNTALYQNRKNKFAGKLTGLEAVENTSIDDPENEKRTMLYAVIGQLDAIEKSIIILYLDDLSYREISEVTGLTETNIGVKLNRIKIKMKTLLDGYGNR